MRPKSFAPLFLKEASVSLVAKAVATDGRGNKYKALVYSDGSVATATEAGLTTSPANYMRYTGQGTAKDTAAFKAAAKTAKSGKELATALNRISKLVWVAA